MIPFQEEVIADHLFLDVDIEHLNQLIISDNDFDFDLDTDFNLKEETILRRKTWFATSKSRKRSIKRKLKKLKKKAHLLYEELTAKVNCLDDHILNEEM